MKKLFQTIGTAVVSLASVFSEKVKDGDESQFKVKLGKFSSKRVLNLVGTSAIITMALSHMQQHDIGKENLILLGIGVFYSLVMSYLSQGDKVDDPVKPD